MGMQLESSSRIPHALGLVFRFPKNTSFNGRILYILLLALVKFVSDSKLNRYERPQRAPLQPTERPAVKRIFFLVIAWISLALGCIGVFVPLLPTTPLVLLATFLFAKSSPRLHAWICKTRVYGAYVKPFKERGGITLARKLQMLGLSYAVMGVSAFFMRNVIAWTVLGVMALFLAWLVAVRIPTISNEEAAAASYPTATMRPSDEITSI